MPGSAYVNHLFELHTLREGGFPFDKNDLSLETWHDLGVLKAYLESKRPRLI